MKGKQIKDYPKYSITPEGEVWSYAQLSPKKLIPRKVTQSKKKYLQVSLYNEHCKRNKKGAKLPRQAYVHRLMWKTYMGEIPKGFEIDHIDTNPHNNHIDNLRLITRRENVNRHNRSYYEGGLSRDKKEEYKRLYEIHQSLNKVAEIMNVSSSTAWRIINDKVNKKVRINGEWKTIHVDYKEDVLV